MATKEIHIDQVENGFIVKEEGGLSNQTYVESDILGVLNRLGFHFGDLNIGQKYELKRVPDSA